MPTHATAKRPEAFPTFLAATVASHRERQALAVADEILTYEELESRTAELARALLASGAGKGSRIALMAPDGVLWVTTFCAALRIGALITPVSTMATPRELAYILRHSDAQYLIGARSFLRHDYVDKLVAALPELGRQKTAGALRVAGAPYLRSIWLDDASEVPWAKSFDDLRAGASAPDAPSRELLTAIESEVVPADDAFVVYTSGSTSTPKAVIHSQGTVARQPPVLAEYGGFSSDDRTMPLLPAFWMGGIVSALQVLSAGGTLVYPPSPQVDDVLDTIQKFGVTRVIVWHMRSKYLAGAAERGLDVSEILGLGAPVRDASGEPIPPEFRPSNFGMTETFATHSGEPAGTRLPPDKPGASGRPVNGIERKIVDPETGVEMPSGEVGELLLRGGALMTGFYKVERSDVFTSDGYYPTKDLMRIDGDDFAHFVGRTGDMIKTKSANVSRLEVQAALEELPDVELAVVAGVPDPELGEVITAGVVPVPGSQPTEEQLKEALRSTLSTYKIPARIAFISHDDIPRTTTGKIRIPDLASAIAARTTGLAPPE